MNDENHVRRVREPNGQAGRPHARLRRGRGASSVLLLQRDGRAGGTRVAAAGRGMRAGMRGGGEMGRSGLRAAPGSAVPGRLRRLALPAALAGASAISAVAGFSVDSLASWALLALSLACACAFVLTARRGRRARRAALAALAAVAAL